MAYRRLFSHKHEAHFCGKTAKLINKWSEKSINAINETPLREKKICTVSCELFASIKIHSYFFRNNELVSFSV